MSMRFRAAALVPIAMMKDPDILSVRQKALRHLALHTRPKKGLGRPRRTQCWRTKRLHRDTRCPPTSADGCMTTPELVCPCSLLAVGQRRLLHQREFLKDNVLHADAAESK